MKFFTRIISSLFLFISVGTQAKEAALADTLRLSLYFKTKDRNPTVEPGRDAESAIYAIPLERDVIDARIEGWDKGPKAGALHSRLDRSPGPPVLAFRSNLLMPLLSVGVEYPVNNRWSAAADFYFPWCPRAWMNKMAEPQMNCIQGLGGLLEGRYWFGGRHRPSEASCGKYRLLGHSLGLVAGAAYYDLERRGKGQQGEVFAIGIGYSYALPLGKNCGIHMEFDMAVGTVYRKWHPYNVRDEGGYLLRGKSEGGADIVSESNWSLFPIKAGISIVVPIFSAHPSGDRKAERR